jgi:hypothetical protein
MAHPCLYNMETSKGHMTDTYIDIQLAANDDGYLTFDQALAYAKDHGVAKDFAMEYSHCGDTVDSSDFAIWLGY